MRTIAWLLLVLVVPAGARADDWLVVAPSCGHPAPGGTPRLSLVYPRPGLPAVVHAGELLVARVRLPTPLTPPPGTQQPRALSKWHAELIGRARTAETGMVELHHAAGVVDVRPDGPQSLVYRATIPVPAWLAPGTYDLQVETPGGSARARALVRVLAQGAVPRLMRWPADGEAPPWTMPVDVWLGDAGDGAIPNDPAAAPYLDPTGVVAALRIGGRLHVLGDCSDRYLPYAEQVAAAIEREGLKRAALPAAVAPASHGASPRWRREGERVALDWGADASGPAELDLLWSVDRAARIEASNAELRWHPAGRLGEDELPLVAKVVLQPGGRVILQPGSAAPLEVGLGVRPRPVAAGAPASVALRGAPGGTRVALRFDERRTAFSTAPVEVALRRPGLRPVLGLAIAPDGRRQAVRGDIEVVTARSGGCAVSPKAHGRPRVSWFWLCPLACLLKRRGPRPRGNRLGPQRR
ncbi:MAG: hypothetical protein OXT09_02745 [Myxococcales bacterium]|nr:hypothetical protein [Myxococcales bacterium]